MKYRQVKRPRPNMQTAHNFFKEGGFLIDPVAHYTSREEREAEIEAIAEDLEQLTKKFPRTQNIEYALLKAHLIIEHVLLQYIRAYATTHVAVKDVKAGFAQKLEIAYLLGFGVNDPHMLPTVEGLNKLRNQIAHTFELDRARLDEILRINSEDYENFSVSTDRQRVTRLRQICNYFCGRVAGQMIGEFAAVQYYKEQK
ncbi:hypothetical protein BOO69_08720 [Sulfitobacter alexandrii]|uniref:Uncharacterized protein n=2 Tax=Sulfitobacter alexandrii TaxID=1917485 RepID=A0A1J0WGM6_9RHOB|nr:hypothetical protein BOO69_08720 [Sulfitobacter alexandrii]